MLLQADLGAFEIQHCKKQFCMFQCSQSQRHLGALAVSISDADLRMGTIATKQKEWTSCPDVLCLS